VADRAQRTNCSAKIAADRGEYRQAAGVIAANENANVMALTQPTLTLYRSGITRVVLQALFKQQNQRMKKG
jgi:hypothetical protein